MLLFHDHDRKLQDIIRKDKPPLVVSVGTRSTPTATSSTPSISSSTTSASSSAVATPREAAAAGIDISATACCTRTQKSWISRSSSVAVTFLARKAAHSGLTGGD